jgi:NTP pyrophosphatase (non-canonical NTP hydrolase)
MDLSDLSEKAMALRTHFGDAARRKGTREWTKEEVMQGFVVDVGDLMRLLMAKSGIRDLPRVDEKLGHELADCLWSILVLAKLNQIDLEQEFLRMIDGITPESTPTNEPNQPQQPPTPRRRR